MAFCLALVVCNHPELEILAIIDLLYDAVEVMLHRVAVGILANPEGRRAAGTVVNKCVDAITDISDLYDIAFERGINILTCKVIKYIAEAGGKVVTGSAQEAPLTL